MQKQHFSFIGGFLIGISMARIYIKADTPAIIATLICAGLMLYLAVKSD